jgi:hypothetical protein
VLLTTGIKRPVALAADPPHRHYTRFQRSLGAMDPQLKMILDEIQRSKMEFGRRFDDHEARWERRFSDLDTDRRNWDAAVDARFDLLEFACGELQHLRVEHDARVAALETAVTDLDKWLPEVEGIVDDLTLKV